jgi:Predicted nucleotide-binding protein containing TIR-like domain
MKPTLFVGSSSESLDVAYAAQKNLEDTAEVVVWTQGIFELTKSYLESLLGALDDSQYALFIFGPDDLTKIRGVETRTARDNVVFELGLFIGRLGRHRCFILMPAEGSDFHLPTDLLGIKTATFLKPSRSDRLQAALGPACHDVRVAIRKQMAASNPVSSNAQDIELLLPVLIPEPEQKHLLNIAEGKTQGYKGGGTVRSELRHLRSTGLIRSHSGRNIGDLTSGGVYNLSDFDELTELGQQWVAKVTRKE